MNEKITCPMCGHEFEPYAGGVCAQCPLNKKCTVLACCPYCGYEVVNPRGSRLARWLNRRLPGLFAQAGSGTASGAEQSATPTLAVCPLGVKMRVQGYARDFPPQRRAHLEAYGVDEGAIVRVLQHTPVTVVEVDNLEVALERDLAAQVLVTPFSEPA